MVAILLLGTFLRCATLDQNRAMEDEALYGYWGLQIASGSDPMLDREPVDKPPLFPYTLALTYALLGPVRAQAVSLPAAVQDTSIVGGPLACATTGCRAEMHQIEMESRLPSLFASIVAIALLYALGTKLYKSAPTGLLAALLLAASPFAVSFGSTAFVDPLLTTWGLGALLAASAGLLGPAGLMSGLAAATKQQGLLLLPLVLIAGILAQHGVPGPRRRCRWIPWLLFLLGFGAVIAGMVAWDQARDQRPGFFVQALISYGGLRFAPFSDLGDRARSWLHLAQGFWPTPWLTGLFLSALVALACAAGLAALRREGTAPSPATRSVLGRAHCVSAMTLAILLFIILFLLSHWLLEVQLWDRYLLVILPLVSLLVARALDAIGHFLPIGRWRAAYLPCVAVFVLVALVCPGLASPQGHVPTGGDHGAYDGIDDLAAYARERLPAGSVLYDHWLGHHYKFYLYGAALHIHWYPDTSDLVQDVQAFRREPRYIAFPSWRASSPEVVALAGAGMSLAPVYETRRRDDTVSFQLFRIIGP